VQRVSIVDDGERVMEVIVEDKQLSLAIGKKGQNVRLAAKLTGWKIDIKSEEEKRKEVELQLGALEVPADHRTGEPTAEIADVESGVETAPAEGAAEAAPVENTDEAAVSGNVAADPAEAASPDAAPEPGAAGRAEG
jgi:transcription antitermination factor NusA-like protein